MSSSEEEISAHVLVDDAILKDIQKKLEKLDMLDKINDQLSTIKHDITNVKSNVTELEEGLNAVNDEALIPFKKHLQKKLEELECRVFIAYPATLKYSDSKGKVITVRNEELKKMESEMEK